MATLQKKSATRAASDQMERPIVYRGIKIQPMPGKRSSLSKAIREDFRSMGDAPRDLTSKG